MSDSATFPVYRGRVGLNLLLRALGLGRGDEVAIQAFTCIAVPEALMASGIAPVYVDIEGGGINMSAGDLAQKITPRTRAVVVQHSFGIPARMDRIAAVAKERGLAVIEDCCHTHSSTYEGRALGAFGVGAFHSYEWGKPVSLGVGGTVTVNDPIVANKVAELYRGFREPGGVRAFKVGLQAFAYRYVLTPKRYWMARRMFHLASRLGVVEGNYNPIGPDRVAADFSLKMLPMVWSAYQQRLARGIEQFRGHSRRLADAYQRVLPAATARTVDVPAGSDVVYVRYPLLVADKARALALAQENKVELAGWYSTPVHPLTAAEWTQVGYQPGSCPQAEDRAAHFVSLPLHGKVTDDDVQRAADLFRRL